MTAPHSDSEFTAPGTLKVSASALQFAREFDATIRKTQRGSWVVVFDWATSMSIRRGPNEPSEDIGSCVTLGAYQRNQIPKGFTQTIDGVEFAAKIPREIWERSAQRLIDLDESLLFKLALR